MIEGDQIPMIYGGDTLFILREAEDAHVLVGDAHIHGLMRGEALQMEGLVPQDMDLV